MPHILWAQPHRRTAWGLPRVDAWVGFHVRPALGIRASSDVARRKDFVRKVPLGLRRHQALNRAGSGRRQRALAGRHQVVCPKLRHHSDHHKWLPVTTGALHQGHYKGKDVLAQFCQIAPSAVVSGEASYFGRVKCACQGRSKCPPRRPQRHHCPPPSAVVRARHPQPRHRADDGLGAQGGCGDGKEDVRILPGVPNGCLSCPNGCWRSPALQPSGRVAQPLAVCTGSWVCTVPRHVLQFDSRRSGLSPHALPRDVQRFGSFFAYQEDLARDDMALLMDHGIYYEFVPLSELGKSRLRHWNSERWKRPNLRPRHLHQRRFVALPGGRFGYHHVKDSAPHPSGRTHHVAPEPRGRGSHAAPNRSCPCDRVSRHGHRVVQLHGRARAGRFWEACGAPMGGGISAWAHAATECLLRPPDRR